MGWLGYNEYMGGNQTFAVSLNLRYLVAILYLVSALFQFIGLALIYNLDKKTLTRMNLELAERHAKAKAELGAKVDVKAVEDAPEVLDEGGQA